MTTLGFDKPLYVLPFDHRGSFQKKMFGWDGELTQPQTEEIAAAKRLIYDAFRLAIRSGVPKAKAGILVDEQFGAAVLRDAYFGRLHHLLPRGKRRVGRIRFGIRTRLRGPHQCLPPNVL